MYSYIHTYIHPQPFNYTYIHTYIQYTYITFLSYTCVCVSVRSATAAAKVAHERLSEQLSSMAVFQEPALLRLWNASSRPSSQASPQNDSLTDI